MIQYPLADVLKVRKLREDKANDELIKSRRLLREAKATLERKEKELEEFREFRERESSRLWKSILGESVTQKELDKFKHELGKLDDKLKTHEEAVVKAESDLKEATENAEKARLSYMDRIRERQKIEEHKEIFMEEAEFLEEQRLEAELSDIQTHQAMQLEEM